MENVVILSAKRTPVGSFQGALAKVPATRLGAASVSAALASSGVGPGDITECIMGQVLTAGAGQAPARQAAIYGGLPSSVVCMTINKVCGSGLKSVMLAADSIRLGVAQFNVAGGQENMTMAPHLLENSRVGYRMGNQQISDSMVKDGLWDPYNNFHMGNAAEVCVKEKHFTREQQDEFAKNSYEKAAAAIAKGVFKNELCLVEQAPQFLTDEEPGRANFDKMPGLKPAFDKAGTITAANASKINDGGAALVLGSESESKKRGLKPLARIVGQTTFAQDPVWFTTAPVGAIKALLAQTGLHVKDIDFWEINEAFAVVTMAAIKELEIPAERVNPHGGAVAIGHPIGASGARILTTLVHSLKTHSKRYGIATLCIGGGEAVAVLIENL